MIKAKNFVKRLLPQRWLETFRFYRNYTTKKDKKIYHFFDEKTLQYLNDYPGFQVGAVNFLNKRLRFSHAASLVHSVEELFCDRIYMFQSDRLQPYVIDCGANIGLSIIFFKTLFPDARILAFEPDKKIFDLLQENIDIFGFKDVDLLNNAVWNKTEELYFYSEGALAGSVTTDFAKKNNKTVITAVDFLPYLDQPVDFLKIDIEGAEFIVVKHISENLKNVRNLFIEYHSDQNKPQELGELLSIISNAGFRYYLKEAVSLKPMPFIDRHMGIYDLQLNIFCYR